MTKLEVLNLLEELLTKSSWVTVAHENTDYCDYDKTIDVKDLLTEIERAKELELLDE